MVSKFEISDFFFTKTGVALGVLAVLLEDYTSEAGPKSVRRNWLLWPSRGLQGPATTTHHHLPPPTTATYHLPLPPPMTNLINMIYK